VTRLDTSIRRPPPACTRTGCLRARRAWWVAVAIASTAPLASAIAADDAGGAPASRRAIDIYEYRVEGADHLSQVEVETALAPFLGPGRELEDVEKARVALEKAYSDKGYQAVTVAIPPQKVRGGVVTLKVTEGTVGRLRVRGASWYSLSEIKREAPSLAEGTVPNFNDIVRDIVVLNQLPDRRVTPALRAGVLPNTIDVDLNVVDREPYHASLELNDRYSAGTTPMRLNGSVRYENLWQQGHSLSFGFQTAPARFSDAQVYSLTYLARFLEVPWLTASVNGVIQNSDISTLGGSAVQGRGRTAGARLSFTLPGASTLFHNLSAGLDFKYYGKDIPTDPFGMPVHYVPLSAQYAASWTGDTSQTQASATVLFNLRGLSSSDVAFDSKRYGATGSFVTTRVEASRTEELRGRFQLFARALGFFSPGPLIPSEQQTLGGAETVRGYLEAQAAGDRVALGGLEARSPSLFGWLGAGAGSWLQEWRFHLFTEGGRASLVDPLPEQQSLFYLWSTGGGTRVQLGMFHGALDVAIPLRSVGSTQQYKPRLHFRVAGEF
jgi:hemolysin activation/secretion protein